MAVCCVCVCVCVHAHLGAASPVASRVVPIQMLGLLEDDQVALGIALLGLALLGLALLGIALLGIAADPTRGVAERQDGATRVVVARRIPRDREAALLPVARREPLAHALLLLGRRAKGAAAREDGGLVDWVDPRQAERDVMALGGEVRGAEERVHRRPSLPRQRGRRDDGNRHLLALRGGFLERTKASTLLDSRLHVVGEHAEGDHGCERSPRSCSPKRDACLKLWTQALEAAWDPIQQWPRLWLLHSHRRIRLDGFGATSRRSRRRTGREEASVRQQREDRQRQRRDDAVPRSASVHAHCAAG
jgi:hypothetical protein